MEFPHKPPIGYEYWTDDYSKTIKRIWIRNISREFIYGDEKHPSSVWGFYCKRKGYIAPINSKKPGKPVRLEDTSPYSAMALKLTPLELAFGYLPVSDRKKVDEYLAEKKYLPPLKLVKPNEAESNKAANIILND